MQLESEARHLQCLGGVPTVPTAPSRDEVRAASKPVGGAEVALEVEVLDLL